MQKTQIIIIGYGKAGKIHYHCYNEILEADKTIEVMAIVDPIKTALPHKGFAPSMFQSLEKVIKKESTETIVDICTPNSSHYTIINKTASLFPNSFYLVEKPMCLYATEADTLLSSYSRLMIAENYLYSDVTNKAISLIERIGARPVSIQTTFNKNRISDSLNGRGAVDGNMPHVFEIETPHQIALGILFLGDVVKIDDFQHEHMPTLKGIIHKHGSGVLKLMHRDGHSVHKTSLLASSVTRELYILLNDGSTIVCNYSDGIDLRGRIRLMKDGRCVSDIQVEDNSVKKTLEIALALKRNPVNYQQILAANRHVAKQVVYILEKTISSTIRERGDNEIQA